MYESTVSLASMGIREIVLNTIFFYKIRITHAYLIKYIDALCVHIEEVLYNFIFSTHIYT